MILYSFQSQTKYADLLKNRFVLGSSDEQVLSHWDASFLDAYKYLSHKMGIKTNPIFAWPIKPDMRKAEFKPEKKASNVLLTLDIPDHKLTFTNFVDWHCVLSKAYFTKEENCDLDLDWENEKHRDDIIKSWDGIFRNSSDDIQVSFERIDISEVINVRMFL